MVHQEAAKQALQVLIGAERSESLNSLNSHRFRTAFLTCKNVSMAREKSGVHATAERRPRIFRASVTRRPGTITLRTRLGGPKRASRTQEDKCGEGLRITPHKLATRPTDTTMVAAVTLIDPLKQCEPIQLLIIKRPTDQGKGSEGDCAPKEPRGTRVAHTTA